MATRGWEQATMTDVVKRELDQKRRKAEKSATMPQERRSKYKAVRTTVDGVTFASKAEARRYAELKALERAGDIRRLTLQPKFDVFVQVCTVGERLKAVARKVRGQNPDLPRVKVCTYVADFSYDERILKDSENDHYQRVIEDVKGMKTPVYRLKKKLVEAQHGIVIREIK